MKGPAAQEILSLGWAVSAKGTASPELYLTGSESKTALEAGPIF